MDENVKVPIYKLMGPWDYQEATGIEPQDAEAKFMEYMADRHWSH